MATGASAQSSGGSTYSIFNIGDLRTSATAAAAGQGGVETAMPSPLVLNSINPAGWGDMRYVTLQAAFEFNQYKVSTESASQYQNSSRLKEISLAFPFSEKYGGTLGMTVRPYSDVAYRTQNPTTVKTSDTTSTTATLTFGGHGGISLASLGSSFSPIKEITIGAAISRYFGKTTASSAVEFAESGLNPSIYENESLYSGWGGRFGLLVEPAEGIRIAAAMETGANLDREQRQISTYIDLGRQISDTTSVANATLSIPPRFSFGLAYQTGRFVIGTDASLQSWNSSEMPNARNALRLGAGLNRLPNPSLNATGFERWNFRFGGFYEQTYYNVPGGGINQMGVTLGAGIPITTVNSLSSNTAMDIALELGTRGTTSSGLTQEMFGKISVELSVSELWFVRARR
jgi:hypothetical protein